MLRNFFVILGVFAVVFSAGMSTGLAELPPSAYEKMQREASEQLTIQVLRVDVSPGDEANQTKIDVTALVENVKKSATGLKVGDIITILYSRTERPAGWVGPGEVPLLSQRETTISYLNVVAGKSGQFQPAAGVMTFTTF